MFDVSRMLLAGVVASICLNGFGGTSSLETPVALHDAGLEPYQAKLLDTAFAVATAIPVDPHIKDRSRAQEKVVDAAFELDQPVRALGYIGKIDNWRGGLAYANYAYYSVEHGVTNEVAGLLKKADKMAWAATQDWRRDTVLRRIEQVESLQKKMPADRATSTTNAVSAVPFDKRLAKIDPKVDVGDLDELQGAMNACIQLYRQFYDNDDFRNQAEQKMRGSWKLLPVFVRLDYLKQLATIALEHGDNAVAIKLLNDAKSMMNDNTWPAEYRIPLMAKFAALRYRAGEHDAALAELADSRTFYEEHNAKIMDIDRADALVPVAEAASMMGDGQTALNVYREALEASVVNPNSRPRAEDLALICTSMASNKVNPADDVWKQIKQIQADLGDPW